MTDYQGYTYSLNVGQVGVIRIEIPVFTIGRGKPILGIICSVHGDETSGLYIVAKVIDYLKSASTLTGTIHIIPAANPVAQMMSSRVSTLDLKDLNRVSKGDESGSLTQRTTAILFEFLSTCDLVIDLHSFEMYTPVTAILLNSEDREIKQKTIEFIHCFSPEIVWVSSDLGHQTSLAAALNNNGIIALPIETTQTTLGFFAQPPEKGE